MTQTDVNALFARAEADFRRGDFAGVRTKLRSIVAAIGEHVAVLHLMALTEARAGEGRVARSLFERALRQAPADPQINNNFANLLDDLGDYAGALKRFEVVLAAHPQFHDARLNRANLYLRLGDTAAAIGDLNAILAAIPGHLGALLTRGAAHLRADGVATAGQDFDNALAMAPDNVKALQGRGRVAMESGAEELAVELYRRALALSPNDSEVVLGLAEALEGVGSSEALPLLTAEVRRNPGWIGGQDRLARMRSEAGAAEDFDADYKAAVAMRADDASLALAHVMALGRAARPADALLAFDAMRQRFGNVAGAAVIELVLASEAGDFDRADAALAHIDNSADAMIARGRYLLRRGDPAAAAAALEPVARADPGAVVAWAHLGLAWRLLDDPAHHWLAGDDGFVGVGQIDWSERDLAALADVLRGLHRTRTHPIGQSLRGGTQTRGRLFGRPEPLLTRLASRLDAMVAAHVAQLPAHDPAHPLLRHRDSRLRFAGSWSVRLTGGGFHVSHIHPAGVLSSAFYVAVPDTRADEAKAGWLEVGVPPVELGLDLPALATIAPVPGRLVLFPSTMFHGTRPFGAGERLTVAFDLNR